MALMLISSNGDDRSDDHTLVEAIQQQVDAASKLSRLGHLKKAYGIFQRAYSLAHGKAVEGLMVAKVACAQVCVAYCCLLSKDDRHAMALEQARLAYSHTEEVWKSLAIAFEEIKATRAAGAVVAKWQPPRWYELAISISVHARHCVALELEFTSGPDSSWEQITALHLEAAELASQLPPDHDVRHSSELAADRVFQRMNGRGSQVASGRQTSQASWQRSTAPAMLPPVQQRASSTGSLMGRSGPQDLAKSAPQLGLASAISANGNVADGSSATVGTDAAPVPLPDGLPAQASRRSASAGVFQALSDLQSLSPARQTVGRKGPKRAAGLAPSDEAPKDIFSKWANDNKPLRERNFFQSQLLHEEGMTRLQSDIREKCHNFHIHDLAYASQDVLMQNRIRYSKYGRAIHEKAVKHKMRLASSPKSPVDSKPLGVADLRHMEAALGKSYNHMRKANGCSHMPVYRAEGDAHTPRRKCSKEQLAKKEAAIQRARAAEEEFMHEPVG